MDQEGSPIDSIAPPQDSANAMSSQVLGDGSNNENDHQNELEGVDDPDEPLDEFSNPPAKTDRFLYLTSNPKLGTSEWHEEHTVKLPKLVDPPRRDENKKGMELNANCKHPLSQWLTSNPKHQRNLIDFNGVIQSESRRETMEKRWREEARQRREKKDRARPSRWEMMQQWKEQKEREAMKTDEEKEQERKRIVAHVKVSSLDSSKHEQLQKYMNSMQNESDDILEINMAEKANVEKEKWKVVGLINPDVHLSTLDHSLNVNSMEEMGSEHFDVVNYHHWIPTVFKVNSKGTKCELLSQIPNLDPYRYKDSLYPMIAELFLHQLPSFESILGFNLRDIPLRVIVKSQDYQLDDCSKKDFYLGNLHKEGLFERIAAVGLYYYQIDDGIKGGELSFSKYAEGRHMDMDSDSESDNEIGPRKWHSSKEVEIQVYEGTSIVFRNDHLDHQVSPLYGSGSRKIISFFLLKQNTSHHIDASKITVNWKAHSKHFVENSLRNLQNTNALARGNEWVVVLVQEYVVGNKEYIKNASDMYRRCRMKMKDLHNALLDEEAEKRMQRAMAGD